MVGLEKTTVGISGGVSVCLSRIVVVLADHVGSVVDLVDVMVLIV